MSTNLLKVIEDLAYAQAVLQGSARASMSRDLTLENARTLQLEKLRGSVNSATGDTFRGASKGGTLSSIQQIREAQQSILASLDLVLANPSDFGVS